MIFITEALRTGQWGLHEWRLLIGAHETKKRPKTLAMSLQLSTADIEPEDVTEAELQGIAELRARILKAQGRDVPLPEQV